MIEDLAGRVAVITGGASGIGLAMATRFAAEGMKVVIADVEGDRLREAVSRLSATGAAVFGRRTDVLQADELSALAEATLDQFGAVHVLCNNAGVFAGGLTWEAPASDWEWVLGVNVQGILHGLRAFMPILLDRGEPAHVVNTVSMAGLINTPFSGPYNVSKHAALSLTETLYHEMQVKQAPIGVSALCPELVRTGIGSSDRNRPPHLKRPGDGQTPEQGMVETAIRESVGTGVDPAKMAERVVDGIRTDKFYLLAEEGTSWDAACRQRLDDIRLRRNPTMGVVDGGN